MEEIKKTVSYEHLQRAELDPASHGLVEEAELASQQAYAPYSGFHVGAALRLSGGHIIKGNNQENAAYPSGLCAERVALFYAGAAHPEAKPEQLAIAAVGKGDFKTDEPSFPCGACLQALWEYEQRNKAALEILLSSGDHIYRFRGVENLLPFTFKFRVDS